jgi:hypothetical protein
MLDVGAAGPRRAHHRAHATERRAADRQDGPDYDRAATSRGRAAFLEGRSADARQRRWAAGSDRAGSELRRLEPLAVDNYNTTPVAPRNHELCFFRPVGDNGVSCAYLDEYQRSCSILFGRYHYCQYWGQSGSILSYWAGYDAGYFVTPAGTDLAVPVMPGLNVIFPFQLVADTTGTPAWDALSVCFDAKP